MTKVRAMQTLEIVLVKNAGSFAVIHHGNEYENWENAKSPWIQRISFRILLEGGCKVYLSKLSDAPCQPFSDWVG
jgi:hypothetical protein